MKRTLFFIGIFALTLALTGLPRASAETLNFYTAPPGGSWHPMGVSMIEIWEDAIPGLSLSHKPGGGTANVMAITQDKADIALATSVSVGDQIYGNEPFKGTSKNMKSLASLYQTYLIFAVPKKSGIETLEDLEGKGIAPGRKGYTAESMAAATLEAAGLSYDDMGKVEFVSDNDAVDLVKDGHIDCFVDMSASLQDPNLVDLAVSRKIHILPITDNVFEKLTANRAGLYKAVVPAGTYNGVDEDVQVLSSRLGLLVHPELPEDLVYKIAKALVENWESEMQSVSDNLAKVPPEDLANEIGVEFHPGAAKYYQERGWID